MGTGIDESVRQRKVQVVTDALKRHRSTFGDLHALLAAVGGLELAAMCGFLLEAARRRTPVVLDGYLALAVALTAKSFDPTVTDYLLASHASAERGARIAETALGRRPILDLGLRLGEGTGAVLALDLVRTALETQRSMATFATAGGAEGGEGRPDSTESVNKRIVVTNSLLDPFEAAQDLGHPSPGDGSSVSRAGPSVSAIRSIHLQRRSLRIRDTDHPSPKTEPPYPRYGPSISRDGAARQAPRSPPSALPSPADAPFPAGRRPGDHAQPLRCPGRPLPPRVRPSRRGRSRCRKVSRRRPARRSGARRAEPRVLAEASDGRSVFAPTRRPRPRGRYGFTSTISAPRTAPS